MKQQESDRTVENRQYIVSVTGATGFVGRYAVRALLERGFHVRALVRSHEKASSTLPSNERLSLVTGCAFSQQARSELLKGAHACVHLIGIRKEIRGKGITFARMHSELTRRMVESCEHLGVSRYIQMSALGTRTEARSPYHRTKHEAETAVIESSLDWTILRPSLIHGRDGEFMQMALGWVKGTHSPWLFLPYFEPPEQTVDREILCERHRAPSVQPVCVQDVATCICNALENDEAIGEIYPIGGAEQFAWPQLLEQIRDAIPNARKKLRPWGIPSGAAYGIARMMESVGIGGLLPYTSGDVLLAIEDNVCSNEKAARQLGYNPSSFNASLKLYADLL